MPPAPAPAEGPPIPISLDRPHVLRLAALLLEDNNPALALQLLEAALAIFHDDVDLLVDASVCLHELGRIPESMTLLQRASELDTTGQTSIELGWAAMSDQDHDTAKHALIHALRCRPENVEELHCDDWWMAIRHDVDVIGAIKTAENVLAHKRARQNHAHERQSR